jgi:hypothetical protein
VRSLTTARKRANSNSVRWPDIDGLVFFARDSRRFQIEGNNLTHDWLAPAMPMTYMEKYTAI